MFREFEMPFVPFIAGVFAVLLLVMVVVEDPCQYDGKRSLLMLDGTWSHPWEDDYGGSMIFIDSVHDGTGSGGPEPAQVEGPKTISNGSQVWDAEQRP